MFHQVYHSLPLKKEKQQKHNEEKVVMYSFTYCFPFPLVLSFIQRYLVHHLFFKKFRTYPCIHNSFLLFSYFNSLFIIIWLKCSNTFHFVSHPPNNGPILHRLFWPVPPSPHCLPSGPVSSPSSLPPLLSPWPVLRLADGGSRWSSTSSRRGTLGGHKGLTAGSQI